jgi:hypothetical protein
MVQQQHGRSLNAAHQLDDVATQAFASTLRGRLIQPSDPEYDAARRVYNGMIDRHPALIARCANVADVIAAVNFAREQQLAVAVRGGGHNGGGLGVCDDGLVIDLSAMRGIRVDPVAQTVHAEGGCLLGDIDHATQAFGLATPFGIMSTTGVGGLTLGGGIGNLTRACGLSIDNLLEVDVVLADGTLVTASEHEHPDLFWALRGGGGNFGVVTSFVFKLHPVSTVYGGPMFWPIEQATELLRWYRAFITQAPEELNGWFAFLNVPPGPPFPEAWHAKNVCGIVWCYAGSMEQAEEVFQPIRQRFPPIIDFVGALPYPALQSMFDPLLPPGLQCKPRHDISDTCSDFAWQRYDVLTALRNPPILAALCRRIVQVSAHAETQARSSRLRRDLAAIRAAPHVSRTALVRVDSFGRALWPVTGGTRWGNRRPRTHHLPPSRALQTGRYLWTLPAGHPTTTQHPVYRPESPHP